MTSAGGEATLGSKIGSQVDYSRDQKESLHQKFEVQANVALIATRRILRGKGNHDSGMIALRTAASGASSCKRTVEPRRSMPSFLHSSSRSTGWGESFICA